MEGRKDAFAALQAMDGANRREWLRAWMGRMGLFNPNQAAPVLCLVRTSLQRMICDPPELPISDQTLKLAWSLEELRLLDGALRTIVGPPLQYGDPAMDNKDGFYSIAYTGLGGSGFGMVALTKGVIAGADAAGGIWDGAYSFDAVAGLVADLQVTLPPNVINALTGGRAAPGANVQKFSVVLPVDLGGEKAITVKTSLGVNINVVLRKIRNFPV